ncbi:unnamed protein product [Chilo suppressalis]|uniref:Uncharacterized protein n=1 Tax=Chilo suppressalis TaxID=168631 RepID=A0ABN8B4N8_CHISP|nr:unnamed protein product [Chilo suppressalis]
MNLCSTEKQIHPSRTKPLRSEAKGRNFKLCSSNIPSSGTNKKYKHHHHQPINVPTAGAQAFLMDGIGRLGHDPPRGLSMVSEIKLTASIYLLAANRLVVGREDGSIVIVSATRTIQLQLLHGAHQQRDDWHCHQLLLGHNGRVNCLLYPHHVHQRYDKAHLVSGGIDFAVCLWDLFSGTLLHRFCVHAGEITQLIVPPHNTSQKRVWGIELRTTSVRKDANSTFTQEVSYPGAELSRQTVSRKLGEKAFVPDPVKSLGDVKANSQTLPACL